MVLRTAIIMGMGEVHLQLTTENCILNTENCILNTVISNADYLYFSACRLNIYAYVPFIAISSSCEPCSMISPFSIT